MKDEKIVYIRIDIEYLEYLSSIYDLKQLDKIFNTFLYFKRTGIQERIKHKTNFEDYLSMNNAVSELIRIDNCEE